MDCSKPTRLRFGTFEADFDSQELFNQGEAVHLQSKPFQFLATLIQHQGQIVTREQMSHVLWPDIYVQVNQGLNAAARKVRIALDDSVESPLYFETLGSEGYRFIHDIEILRWSTGGSEEVAKATKIAVLPFRCEDSHSHLRFGLSAELIAILARVHPRLKVIAPGSSFGYSNGTHTPESAGVDLGVHLLLSGEMRNLHGKLELKAELLDVEARQVMWRSVEQHPLAQIGAGVTALAERVVQSIQPATSLPSNATCHQRSSGDLGAFQQYLCAQNQWIRQTPTSVREALKGFRALATHEPDYAPAHAGVANSLLSMGNMELAVPRFAYQQAMQAAERALQLEPEMPEATIALAWTKLNLEHDWAPAMKMFERLLQSSPSLAFAYLGYGALLLSRGRMDEGVSAIEQAYLLDPRFGPTSAALSTAFYYARKYDEALRQARRTIEIDPESSTAHSVMGSALLAQRRFSEAVEEMIKAVQVADGNPVAEAHLAYAYAQVGKVSEALQMVNKLESRAPQLPRPAYLLALTKLALGDVTAAMRYLEVACQERFQRTLFMSIDPRLDVLRGSRHFEEMCKRVREPENRRLGHTRGGAA